MIDYDDIDSWSPVLSGVLTECVSHTVRRNIAASKPKYIEDARALLFELADRDAVLDATLAWLQEDIIAGYHGSRLTDIEVRSIQEQGLIPLAAEHRRDRLIRALSPHPRWNDVSDKLDDEIIQYGPNERAGRREKEVHLTLSKSGVVNEFNHYLEYGSEFDQHVAQALLGQEGLELLAKDGNAVLITVAVPGKVALEKAHPYFSINDIRGQGELPNIVSEFIEGWSYRLAYPDFQCCTLGVDCGMVFKSQIPPDRIVRIEKI